MASSSEKKSPGKYPPARWIASPNRDARPQGKKIDMLVIHNISLPPGEYGTGAVEQLFTNNLDPTAHPYYEGIAELRVSAHLLIERDGSICQFVDFHERAWHAGISSYCGEPGCNDRSIGIELEGSDDEPFTDAQYASLASATKFICQQFEGLSAERIVGHCDIAPGRKTDPGAAFDWDRYLSAIIN